MKTFISRYTTEIYIYSFVIAASGLIPFLLYQENYKLLLFIICIPVSVYFFLTFKENFRLFYIASIFVGFYVLGDARIYLIHFVSLILILFFILNNDSSDFHKISVPSSFKYITIFLIFAVLLSSFNSPFASSLSIYYGFVFFGYILTGYVIYRSAVDTATISKYLDYFYKSVAFYSVLIILEIFASGKIRSFGISGITFSDIIVIALLIIIIKSYAKGSISKNEIVLTIIIFISLITTLSRFAWVGFISSLLYGIITVNLKQGRKFLNKKTVYLISGASFGLLIIFITGLYRIIFNRFFDVSFTVLDSSRETGTLSNTLDSRALIWLTALNTFIHNKFTGVGYFMFYKVSEHYNIIPQNWYDDLVFGLDAHSTLLNFLADTGILGTSLFLLYLFTAFYFSFKAIKLSETNEIRNISLVLNIILFFIISTSFYSGAFTFSYNAFVLHSIIGLVIANYVIIKNKYFNRIEKTN